MDVAARQRVGGRLECHVEDGGRPRHARQVHQTLVRIALRDRQDPAPHPSAPHRRPDDHPGHHPAREGLGDPVRQGPVQAPDGDVEENLRPETCRR